MYFSTIQNIRNAIQNIDSKLLIGLIHAYLILY